ncbi:uncharacterized protein IL334_001682 [Kwoniella shivajii]|uniref:Uncharacterized protein n=1 Tax=Kwoniella shivajii TaxID=564305 RepID=A0ABZ1CSL0_9TREE|nr:hypothetical protein IL334_001682 [Kwoniella shivajii]
MILALSPYTMTTPRSSSPLNPNSHVSSSSPLSSPTPSSSASFSSSHTITRGYQAFQLPSYRSSTSSPNSSSPSSRQTRYTRPSKRSSTSLPPSSSSTGNDLFSEGTTPMEGLMWREKFTRRVEEREKRKINRNKELDKRRGMEKRLNFDQQQEEEEFDRKAQEDDEEIFRRLVVLQRKKSKHAAMVSHELETGGSDPTLPEFWEDELDNLSKQEKELLSRLEGLRDRDTHQHFQSRIDQDHQHQPAMDHHTSSPSSMNWRDNRNEIDEYDEQEEWEKEATLAEQVERDSEEIEFADHVEQSYLAGEQVDQGLENTNTNTDTDTGMEMEMDINMEVDWEAFDSMDIE